MRRIVHWSGRASNAVKEILETISLDSRMASMRVADRIADAAQRVGERSIGRVGRVEGTYEKSVTGLPYILCYEVRSLAAGEEQIVILHVIHTARDWPEGAWPN